MIPNPYIVGNPIEDSRMFFGRDDDFAYIRSKVAGAPGGGMVVLCGTRRSGKTSILFQIRQGRLGDAFVPVLIDLQSNAAENDDSFFRLLAGRIAAAGGESPDPDGFTPGEAGYERVVSRFAGLCRRVRGARGGLVLMFDEYELFEDAIDEGRLSTRVLDLLGELIRSEAGVFVVFAGSTRIEERRAGFWASCLGPSLHRRISFLSRNDAMRLIKEPVAGLVEYEEGVPEGILDLSAGQPFYTQVVCQTVVDHLNDEGGNRATNTIVEAVVREIIDNPLPHMIFTWGSLGDVERIALAVLAELARDDPRPRMSREILDHLAAERTGITLAGDRLNEALEHLFIEDLLLKEPDGESYRFRMGLWQRWVERMHSVWQVLDEIKAEGRPPQAGVIRLARRRLQRLSAAAAVAAVGVVLWFANGLMRQPVLQPEAPDSTWVSFATDPPGARFILDNYLLGISPRDSVKVPAGRFAYRSEKDGYRVRTDSVTLAPDTLTAILVVMEELTGSLRVESQPAGARVLVDGRPWPSATPTTVAGLPARSLHDVRIEHDGYLPARFNNVQVVADSTVVVAHDFQRRRHALTVVTDPPGATVVIDGAPAGEAPVSLPSVLEGEHRLELSLAGHARRDTVIGVPVRGDRVTVRLNPLPPGLLSLRVQPYADIYVDGRQAGLATVGRDTMLPVGLHRVEFRHPHFPSHFADVTITPRDTVVVQHRFGGGP